MQSPPLNYKILPALLWTAGLILIGNIFAACVTSPTGLAGVRLRMDKSEVLEVAGSPKQTFREDNKDGWIYIYTTDKREWSRVVTFADGKVVKIGRPVPKDSKIHELEATDTWDEFEAKARQQTGNSNNPYKFKTIDGSGD